MKKAFSLLGIALACAGCSGATAPGPPDLFAPSAAILFPLRLTMTDAARVTVSGMATDDVGIASVRVNGVLAQTGDGFGRWRASVPLILGPNALTVEVHDRAGKVVADADTVTIERVSPLWAAPTTVALDLPAQRALVADGARGLIFSVDLTTGQRSILVGSGPDFVAPVGMVVDRGRLLLVDSVVAAVFSIDLATGVRSVLAQGPPFSSPQAIVLDSVTPRALVVDAGTNTLFSVDLETGARAVIAAGFDAPRGVAFDGAGNRAFVTDSDGLHEVDLAGGIRAVPASLLSPGAVAFDPGRNRLLVIDGGDLLEVDPAGSGSSVLAQGFSFPHDVEIDAAQDRAVVVDSGADALIGIDLATGFRSSLSRASFGSGPTLVSPRDVTLDPARSRAFLADFTAGVFAIDLVSGARTVLDGPGPALGIPLGAAYDSTLNRVLVADTGLRALVAVFAATGDRVVLSDGARGSGTNLSTPVDVAHDRLNNRAVIVDSTLASVVSIDLSTGDRTIVSGPARGSGPAFSTPRSLAHDQTNNRIFVVDRTNLFMVDLASGDRSLLGGAGPSLVAPAGVAHDPDRRRLLVVDTALDAVVAVDLSSGRRTILVGEGPPLLSPEAILYDSASRLILVVDSGLGALVVVEPASGDRVIVSK